MTAPVLDMKIIIVLTYLDKFHHCQQFCSVYIVYSLSKRPFWNVSLVASTKHWIALELTKTNTQGPGAHLHHMPSAPVQCLHLYTGTGPLPEFENGYLPKRGGGGMGWNNWVPNNYHDWAPCPGTKCEHCLNCTIPEGGVLPEKLGGDVQYASWNPYPISEQNLWFSLPYFRPDP